MVRSADNTPESPHPDFGPDSGAKDLGPSTPFSPADHALLDAYLAHGLSLPHLSAAVQDPAFSTLDALAWLNQPHIQHALTQVHAAHNLAASIRRARASFKAIETLETLATATQALSERRRAATAILNPASPKRGNKNRDRQGALARAPRASSAPSHQPPAPDQPHSPAPAAGLPDHLTPEPTGLDDLLDLQDDLQADAALDSELDDDNDPDDEFSDAALDAYADQIEQHLGVPLTHPDILAAITQGRLHELQDIAAAIRANAPP